MKRMEIGKKCDLILRESKANHEETYEFGVGESGKEYNDSKHLLEGNLVIPKVLKDMLDQLITNNNNKHKVLATFGIQTSGLTITLLVADRPTRYIILLALQQSHN
jgi:hypothetical protein